MLEKVRCQENYDNWHQSVCEEMSKLYLTQGVSFCVGQS